MAAIDISSCDLGIQFWPLANCHKRTTTGTTSSLVELWSDATCYNRSSPAALSVVSPPTLKYQPAHFSLLGNPPNPVPDPSGSKKVRHPSTVLGALAV